MSYRPRPGDTTLDHEGLDNLLKQRLYESLLSLKARSIYSMLIFYLAKSKYLLIQLREKVIW